MIRLTNAVDLYIGNEFIRHKLILGEGRLPFIGYIDRPAREFPDNSTEFVR